MKDKNEDTEPTEMTESGGSEWEGLSPAEAKLKMARQLDGMDAGGIFDVPGTKGRVMTTLHEHVTREREEHEDGPFVSGAAGVAVDNDGPLRGISRQAETPSPRRPRVYRVTRAVLVAMVMIVLVLWAIYTIL